MMSYFYCYAFGLLKWSKHERKKKKTTYLRLVHMNFVHQLENEQVNFKKNIQFFQYLFVRFLFGSNLPVLKPSAFVRNIITQHVYLLLLKLPHTNTIGSNVQCTMYTYRHQIPDKIALCKSNLTITKTKFISVLALEFYQRKRLAWSFKSIQFPEKKELKTSIWDTWLFSDFKTGPKTQYNIQRDKILTRKKCQSFESIYRGSIKCSHMVHMVVLLFQLTNERKTALTKRKKKHFILKRDLFLSNDRSLEKCISKSSS